MVPTIEGMQNSSGFVGTDKPSQTAESCRRLECGCRFMPNVSMKRLTRTIENESDPRAKLRLLACRERKKGHSIRKIARYLGIAYSTARDWLVRIRDRGLKGRFNRKRKGRSSKLPRSLLKAVRKWLRRQPKEYGFESGSWQLNLILEMIRREFGIDCKIRTLRRKLRKIRFSYRKDRPVPHKSASRKGREAFKKRAGERARELGREGYAVFVEDEATVLMSQKPGYGWRPTGGRDAVQTGFSKRSVKLFGIMGKDELHVRMAEATNSETFKEFMEGIRKSHPKFYMVLDNVSYHKSQTINRYVEGTGGDIELEFLPPYTPQLNPIETVWRDLKKRLAGRYFRSIEELKTAITVILEKEMNHRLKGYLVE